MNRTYNEIVADQLESIYSATRKLTFSKNMSAAIVGGRGKLEKLVAENKIRAEKRANIQNSKWECNASDVLRYAFNPLNS